MAVGGKTEPRLIRLSGLICFHPLALSTAPNRIAENNLLGKPCNCLKFDRHQTCVLTNHLQLACSHGVTWLSFHRCVLRIFCLIDFVVISRVLPGFLSSTLFVRCHSTKSSALHSTLSGCVALRFVHPSAHFLCVQFAL